MGASCSAPERACCSPTNSCHRTANHLAKDPERLALAIGQTLAKAPDRIRQLDNGETADDEDGGKTADSGKCTTASPPFSLSSTAGSEDLQASESPKSPPVAPLKEALLVGIDERHRIAASSDASKHRRRQRRRQHQLEKRRAEGLPGLPEFDDDDDLGDPSSGLESSEGDELGGSCSDDTQDTSNPRSKANLNRTMTASMQGSSKDGKFARVSTFTKAFSRDPSTFNESGRKSITGFAASGIPMMPGKRTLSRAMSKVQAPGHGLARAFSAGAGLARGVSGFVEGGRSKSFSRSESIVVVSSVGVIRAGSAKLKRMLSRGKSTTSSLNDPSEGIFVDSEDVAPPKDSFKRGMSMAATEL